jgi:hypothetical protein
MWVYVAAFIAAVTIGFASGWNVRAWKADHDRVAQMEQEAQDARRRVEHSQGAAITFEKVREAQRVRTVYITREVERAVQADTECSDRPLPPGLRDALTRAASDANTSVPDSAVPSAPAASVADLGRLGDGLRGRLGGAERMPGPP